MTTDFIGELFLSVELYDAIELCTFVEIPSTLNGTNCLIKKDGSVIVGQLEATVSFSGSPIQVNNPSTKQWVTYLNNQLQGRNLQVSGSIIYNNEATYQQVRRDIQTGKKSNYSVEFAGAQMYSAAFIPTGLSDSSQMGDRLTSSITLQSSGTVASIS